AHLQLIVFNDNLELAAGETRHGNGNHEVLGAVFALVPLDIVGRVAVRRPGQPVDTLLEAVEAEEKGRGKHRDARHETVLDRQATSLFPTRLQWHRKRVPDMGQGRKRFKTWLARSPLSPPPSRPRTPCPRQSEACSNRAMATGSTGSSPMTASTMPAFSPIGALPIRARSLSAAAASAGAPRSPAMWRWTGSTPPMQPSWTPMTG